MTSAGLQVPAAANLTYTPLIGAWAGAIKVPAF